MRSSDRGPAESPRIKLTKPILRRTLRYARAKYFSNPDVVAIGIGTKFKRRSATSNHRSIQFFVVKKKSEKRCGADRLPKYIVARGPGDVPLRTLRIATDVIPVGRVEAVCGAGGSIGSGGGQMGVATLMFRDKQVGGGESFLLTCAHVAGDVHTATGQDLMAACDPATMPFARTVAMAQVRAGTLKYDVALAKVLRPLTTGEDMVVDGPSIRLMSLQASSAIRPSNLYQCRFPVSNTSSGDVISSSGAALVAYGGADCVVENAFVLRAVISPGNSGGLIYSGNTAVGIAFARSEEGWTWFHALGDALQHAIALYGAPLRCL